MATACIPQMTFEFERKGKPIVARFDQPHASSDGGAVLLKTLDDRLAADQAAGRLPGATAPAGQGAASDPASWCGSASSGSPVATPTATTPPGWPTIRSTSCCSTAIRSRAGPGLAADAVALRERAWAGRR